MCRSVCCCCRQRWARAIWRPAWEARGRARHLAAGGATGCEKGVLRDWHFFFSLVVVVHRFLIVVCGLLSLHGDSCLNGCWAKGDNGR